MRLITLTSTLLWLVLGALGNPAFAQVLQQKEYDLIGYYQPATQNRVAALAERLQNGELKLEWQDQRGYFDALLAALEIDTHSQTLVFSKTSLQYQLIDTQAPRGIYFNDDTYIGWVQNSSIVEVMAMDAKLGIVFYTFDNKRNDARVNTETGRCLVCHDSTGVTGGGTPELLAHSSLYNRNGINLKTVSGDGNVTDSTPVDERWGGWYVTGQHGAQKHLGNIQLNGPEDLMNVDALLQGNMTTLDALFDTRPYPAPTSDIVALMVLEHQLTVQNQLTYVKFKAPAVLQRIQLENVANAASWDALPEKGQRALTRMLDNLANVLLFHNTAPLADHIEGLPQYQSAFLAAGPRDGNGRSLREFDLQTRLFRYPLSYEIYSAGFDSLPAYAKDYLYQRIAAVLEGRSEDSGFDMFSTELRREALEILSETKPDIIPYLAPVFGS